MREKKWVLNCLRPASWFVSVEGNLQHFLHKASFVYLRSTNVELLDQTRADTIIHLSKAYIFNKNTTITNPMNHHLQISAKVEFGQRVGAVDNAGR